MQRSILNEKAEYYMSAPCDPSETCVDGDFDPCDSSDDINEKDLAVILREEAAKLQKDRTAEQKEAKDVDGVSEAGIIVKSTQKEAEGLQKKTDGGLSAADKTPDSRLPRTEEQLSQEGQTLDNSGQKSGKKRNCKFIKNPFFTNRLKFSTDLPPPPPGGPPPQFLPLVEETDSSGRIICPNKRKKCKKRKEDKKYVGKGKDRIDDGGGTDEATTEEEDVDDGGGTDEATTDVDAGGGGTDGVGKEDADRVVSKRNDDDGGGKGGKKKCRKKGDLPPCRKRGSNVSISLQPPQIPPTQRDLPPTSPKDIPEVDRQLLMACGGRKVEKKCKKRSDKLK